ncbi:MAG: bifunctional 2-C-methyl-D-erythritol 4-phosphate cytidylyltransferase/2-C-methyl-D-erythritol 2,4-cyclodiphosphate synthase [Sphingomonadales bacterium]
MSVAAVIVAAGKGRRVGGDMPKQYRLLDGKSVLRHTLEAFCGHPRIDRVLVVIGAGDENLHDLAVKGLDLMAPVEGGDSRQASVLRGLEALAGDQAPSIVLIHDAARCFVSSELISRVIDAVGGSGEGALPALPVTDSLKRGASHVEEAVERKGLWRAQTPQGFPFQAILKAHREFQGEDLSDDAAVAAEAGLQVQFVEGSEDNIKLTEAADFERAEGRLAGPDVRTGLGFDVHRFEAGDVVVLAGIEIPFDKKLKGHSDADVAMHALTDALLGALAEGDIGDHFPPGDPQWKDAPSEVFLRFAGQRARDLGAVITHLDLTIICEAPKISPYRGAMRDRLADILGIDAGRVSVKATTTEQLGFCGRGEGIAAQAIATIRMGG